MEAVDDDERSAVGLDAIANADRRDDQARRGATCRQRDPAPAGRVGRRVGVAVGCQPAAHITETGAIDAIAQWHRVTVAALARVGGQPQACEVVLVELHQLPALSQPFQIVEQGQRPTRGVVAGTGRSANLIVDVGTWEVGVNQAHGFPKARPSCYSRRVTSRLVATAIAGLAFLLAGCDNNSTTPTSPSGGTLQVTATRSVLRSGEAQPLTVSSSAGAPVTGVTWASTDTSVLAVSATGIATAVRAGRVTVTATVGSSSGTLSLRVVPDYQGTWSGGITRLQLTCSPGSTSPLCVPGASTAGTVTLRVQQTGDQVAAVLTDSASPGSPVPVVGQVQADDQLALAGRIDSPLVSPTLRVEVATLRGSVDAALGTMGGSYQWLVDRAPVAGGALQADYRAQVQFRDLRR